MKKILASIVLFGALMFVNNAALACDCGCENPNCDCACHKVCPKDCDYPCHKGEQAKNCDCDENCDCACHKDCSEDCQCECHKKQANCDCDKKCSKDCQCDCCKNKAKKFSFRKKIKCNCDK